MCAVRDHHLVQMPLIVGPQSNAAEMSRRSLARILNHRSFGPASGALGGTLTDFAINDEFMKQLAESIRPGDAALFLLMKEMTADKVGEQIKDYGGVVLKTSLADTREQMLRNALAGAVASDAGVPAAGLQS